MRSFIVSKLSSGQKRKIKSYLNRIKQKFVNLTMSYSQEKLERKFHDVGLKKGDAVLIHSGWSYSNGFIGTPQDVIRILKKVVGTKGTLLMVSMPYRSATSKYLKEYKSFNVRKTSGKMGLLSEIFRRQKDVSRSLHPCHPIIVWGKDADWFIQEHENCVFSCGRKSPFGKIAGRKGKILFFDVKFNTMTFFHHIEHIIQEKLPFPLYDKKEYELKVINKEGQEIIVKARAFSDEAVTRRRPLLLEKELLKKGCFSWDKIGNTSLGVIRTSDALECANKMISEGRFFYDL
ncbi:hypothetical protein DSCA_12150 [Desulfosarcina alkanivorans]|uniref:Aminoglycoside N(3)-acetyltransferase n=1 Tax=Desulfosarcina alkanivorans TaxID=571177 RepID=A0A5K7YFM9_9BACT|nr:AAC(3) family N-acetyltransferase [Desulfosarcina alkanivorans]BBO67285.1 hypothetical protein DSCA_12150 [Desulfosarcina alkanivorans]